MMRTRWLPLLLISTAAFARPSKPDLTMRMDDYFVQMRDFCFPSGLRVILQEDHANPLVSVHAVYEGGQRSDAVGREGTAHLAEHLWFRSRHGDVDTRAALEGIGATFNAHTGSDEVGFETLAPSEALVPLLRLEAMRMTEPLAGLGEAEIAVERDVVASEQRLGGRPAWHVVRDQLAVALFPAGHPYARSGESAASVQAIGLADVQAFAAAQWRPEKATLVVVGDFSLDAAWTTLLQTLPRPLLVDPANPKSMEPGACGPRVPKTRAEPPPAASIALAHAEAPVGRPVLAVAWTVPGAWRDGHADLEIAADLLGAMVQSRVSALPTSSGVANPAQCDLLPDGEASTLLCLVEVDERRSPERALHFVALAAQDLRDPSGATIFGPWLESAYNDERRDIFESMEDLVSLTGGRGAALAQHAHRTGSVTVARDRLVWLDAMTPARVSEIFRKYVTAERMAAVVLQPSAGATAEATEDRLLSAPRGPRLDPGAVDAALLAERIALPDLSGKVEKRLANGLNVVVLPHGAAPRVRAGLVLRGGEWSAPERGLDALTWGLSDLFYTQATFSLMEAPRPFLGAWGVIRDGYGKVVTLTGSSGNLDGQMYLLRDLVDHATVDTALKPREIERAAAVQAYWSGDPDVREAREAQRRLLPGIADPEAAIADMRAVPGSSVKTWHRRVWQPANATLLVVGKVDPAEAIALAEGWFGDWKAGVEPVPEVPAPAKAAPSARVVLFAASEGAGTAAITLRCAVRADDASEALGKVLESAAWEQLREQHGLVYGVRADVRKVAGQAVLGLSTATSPEASGAVVASWFGLVEAASRDVEDAAVARAKLDVARAIGLSLASPDGVFVEMAYRIRRDEGADALAGLPGRLAAVDAAAVKARAATCSGHEVVTVVGPASVEASLTAANVAFERLP